MTKEEFLERQRLDITNIELLEETFNKLRGLKIMGFADTSTSINYNEYKLPAGAYEDFKPFNNCFNIINRFYESDEEVMIEIMRNSILTSVKNIGYDEKITAIVGWNNYYRALRKDNKQLFTAREITDLTNKILDEKNENEKKEHHKYYRINP